MGIFELTDCTQESDTISIEIYNKFYKTYIVKNVSGYYCNTYTHSSWCVIQDDSLEDKTSEYYFCIDGPYAETIGHYMFESAIYLDLFKLLKNKYSNIKLVIGNSKRFKSMFLDYFDIDHNDTVNFIPKNFKTTCIFPSPIMLLNNTSITLANMHQINNFWNKFKLQTQPETTIKYLIMPRQKKENYAVNDRHVGLEKIISWFEETKIPHTILHTDKVYDFKYQIEKVNSADTIIVTDGAALWINGMFAHNKNIIVAGRDNTFNSHDIYAKGYYIDTLIENQSKSFIRIENEDNVIKFIQESHQI